MKLIKIKAENFASYNHVHLDFNAAGLTLISGPTGSGKSTLLDLVCWTLYGITAKNGNVDEVRSWNHYDRPTKAILSVSVGSRTLRITRIRALQPSNNDLYWEDESGIHRGKNSNETQQLLEKALGCTSEQYLVGSYFHEFSKTALFFLSKAKDRRAVFENIAELEFASRLGGASSEARTRIKKELKEAESDLTKTSIKLTHSISTHKQSVKSSSVWEEKKNNHLETLRSKMKSFDTDTARDLDTAENRAYEYEVSIKQKIEDIRKKIKSLPTPSVCGECGAEKGSKDITRYQREIDELSSRYNPHLHEIKIITGRTNQFSSLIAAKESEENPFLSQIQDLAQSIEALQYRLAADTAIVENLNVWLTAHETLTDLSFTLRGELLKRSIKTVEEITNKNLNLYFDSELKVNFSLDADELNTEIYKNGNICVYSQLSKGQRGLLKLTFSVAVMEVMAQSTGVTFNTLFFDEALDGYDNSLKIKAYRLFEDLALKHETIYVIDHSDELKAMFGSLISVTMENDVSTLK